MMKFAEAFPDEEIVASLSQQLSWSQFRELLPLEQSLQREFYAEMCPMGGWRVRTPQGANRFHALRTDNTFPKTGKAR
jgi:hypothetical protein